MTINVNGADQNAWTPEEIAAESAFALPAKEVMSLLDLNATIDLALSASAPIDLAIGANANVAAPIEAAVGANVLSLGSAAEAATMQGVQIHQGITGDATATATQHSGIAQGSGSTGAPAATEAAQPTASPAAPTAPDGAAASTTPDTLAAATALPPADTSVATPTATSLSSALDGGLLNVDVNLHGNLDLATPIDGAVAAQANVAAPIYAAVSANVGTVDSQSIGVADQSAVIDQNITGNATATGDQTSNISQ